jgi:hypothetical protein
VIASLVNVFGNSNSRLLVVRFLNNGQARSDLQIQELGAPAVRGTSAN